ncbi:MAG: TolC family protein [Flavobacteriaceae bacterium]|jgi:outer membrane protein TolC|nr:TolC family protein [Flavobacteriaceae bacterium]
MKNLKKIILTTSILGVFSLSGQERISLENAYNKAIQNNLNIKSGQLHVNYREKIKKSYATVDPLNISGEIGQIGSAYFDNKISVEQTLRLPKFYNTQKQVLEEEWKNSALNLEVQKWALKKEISLIYNQLNYLDEKEKLLKKADSIYADYYKNAELRLKKGESNILEKTTAENYRSAAQIQLQNLLKDRDISLYQFNYLINDGEIYRNENSDFFNSVFWENASDVSENSPILRQLEQQKQIENAKLAAEKSKLLPSFSLGINSTTIKGTGADEKYYNASHRFQSGIIGIGIPVFNSAQKSVIEGQKINQEIAENNYQIGLKNLKNQYSQIFSEYQKLADEQNYYKTKGLKNAETILNTANRLFYEGEINYLEWSILMNQSLEIENKYIDNQKLLNEKIIEINYLKGNKQ